MSSKTLPAPKRVPAPLDFDDKRISVDLPVVHIDTIAEVARDNERTIPAQIRLIVREWIANQSAKVA